MFNTIVSTLHIAAMHCTTLKLISMPILIILSLRLSLNLIQQEFESMMENFLTSICTRLTFSNTIIILISTVDIVIVYICTNYSIFDCIITD